MTAAATGGLTRAPRPRRRAAAGAHRHLRVPEPEHDAPHDPQSRVGCSSSPMIKSSSTMPNSDTCRMRPDVTDEVQAPGPDHEPAAT